MPYVFFCIFRTYVTWARRLRAISCSAPSVYSSVWESFRLGSTVAGVSCAPPKIGDCVATYAGVIRAAAIVGSVVRTLVSHAYFLVMRSIGFTAAAMSAAGFVAYLLQL